MKLLPFYGWNEELFRQKQDTNSKDCLHGRGTVTHKTCFPTLLANIPLESKKEIGSKRELFITFAA